MDTKPLTDALNQVRQKVAAADEAYQTAENNLRNFLQQAESRLRDVQKKIQALNQKCLDYQTNLDQTLQTLEQDITKNNGLIASLSPGNTLSKKEQVSTKRLALLKALKQVEQAAQQVDQELAAVLGELQQGVQQAQDDIRPVYTGIHDVNASLNSLGGQIETFLAQSANAAQVQAAPQTLPVSGVDSQVLSSLNEARLALMQVQQGLERSRMLSQVQRNIEDFGCRYGLS